MHGSEFLRPKLIQLTGLVGLVALGVFWALSGRLEPLLLAMAGSLVTGGNILEAYLKVKAGSPAVVGAPPDEER